MIMVYNKKNLNGKSFKFFIIIELYSSMQNSMLTSILSILSNSLKIIADYK